ncbi:MAG: hypothetical protein ACRDBO_03765 [Lachnospiraceae bacterium]
MFKYGKKRQRLALLMSVVLLAVSACPVHAAADQNQTVYIGSAEAFLEFAGNCTSEDFSRGRRFALEQDISLAAVEFVPAAVFAGEFDGNGYTISGITYRAAGSNLGLFRYVENGAAVRNLHVEGRLEPGGTRKNVGGIAGVNRGLLQGCVFTGAVMADEAAGGIAGWNEAGGRIENCRNNAEITGNRMVGGIAGSNEGEIFDSINQGCINTSKEGVTEEDKKEYDFTPESLPDSLRVEKVNDVGGITGFSTGTIQNSSNYGTVGIAHTGYNIGGIAGRQSGLIYQCSNYGDVTGRKDVGGITGQLEPFLEILYQRDTFDQLQDEFDALSDIGDDMSDQIRGTTDTASENFGQAKDIMNEIKQYSRQQKDFHKEERDQFDEAAGKQLDKIEEIIDAVEIDFGSSSARRAASRLRSNINKAKGLIGQMDAGAEEDDILDEDDIAGSISGDLEDAYLTLVELADIAEAIVEDTETLIVDGFGGVEDGLFDLKDDLDSLRIATRSLSDLTRARKDDLLINLDEFDVNITEKLDRLYDQLDVVSDDLKSGKNRVRTETDRLDDQLGSMRQVVTDGKDRLDDKTDKISDDKESLYDDISDRGDIAPEPGSVIQCRNQGRIISDYQAGGIAGMIGIELSLDPETDIEKTGNRSLNADRYARAVVSSCRNDGDITAEYEYAGGIAGKAALGALTGNQNYGNATVTDGDYAGGIAGSSSSVIRNNYSMSQVTGNNYLGGIAGWGCDLKENYAMVMIHCENGEWIGSIAGAADADGEISSNYYVDEKLGAIDGVSRTGEAAGLAYDVFTQLEHVPQEFLGLTVTYLADGQIVKVIPCMYGQPLSVDEIPEAPVKDGFYYIWEAVDLSSVKGNLRIEAIYQPWTTTIASSADPLPLLLAEANFHPDARLTVAECEDDTWQLPENWNVIRGYECRIDEQDPQLLTEAVVFRVLAKDYGTDATVGIVSDGRVLLVETRRDGDYLVFKMAGQGTFVILEPHRRMVWLVLPAVTGVLLAGAGVWIYRKKWLVPEVEIPEDGDR